MASSDFNSHCPVTKKRCFRRSTQDTPHPTTANTGRWLEVGLTRTIDTSRLTEWNNIFPTLKAEPGVGAGNEVMSVPFDWGRTSVVYREDQIELEEESYGLLWDERYRGWIAVLGGVADLVPVAALYAGYDPYNLTPDQEEYVLELLKEQKSLLRFYADDVTTIQQAIASGELLAAMAWGAVALGLVNSGIPVRFMQPKEGVLTWLGGIVMTEYADQDKACDLTEPLFYVRDLLQKLCHSSACPTRRALS